MSVELDPNELGFKRPFTQEISQTLRLRNPHSDSVAFKVKTTAPKKYCVRPNSGKIEAGGAVEVQVLLQAMREDPAPDEKCKDKFLVQSVAIPADKDTGNISSVWQSIEQTSKSSISEKKIRVNFLPADGDAVSTPVKKQVNGVSHTESTPSQQSPSMLAFTPTSSDNKTEEKPASRTVTDTVSGAAAGAAATVQSTARSAVNAVPTNSDEVKDQLAAAHRQIDQLRKQLAEQTGLRQRKTDTNSESKAPATQQIQQAAQGVPLQVVAALCLLSFILAYWLF